MPLAGNFEGCSDRLCRWDTRRAAEEIPNSRESRGRDVKGSARLPMQPGRQVEQSKQVGIDRNRRRCGQLIDAREIRVGPEDRKTVFELIDQSEALEHGCRPDRVLAEIQIDLELGRHGSMGEMLQPLFTGRLRAVREAGSFPDRAFSLER